MLRASKRLVLLPFDYHWGVFVCNLLIVLADNLFQHRHVKRLRIVDTLNQFRYVRPAMLIKSNSDCLWLMSPAKRYEFASSAQYHFFPRTQLA